MKRIRLSEQVIDEIEKMILKENFKDGDKFYSENELTKKLDVSRTSVREAIRILEISGKLKVYHGKGIYIRNPLEKGINEFANWLKNNESSLLEHFELRLIIETKAAAYSAKNIQDTEIAKLKENMEQFKECTKLGKLECLINLDREFHHILAKSTKNRTYYTLMKAMTNTLQEGWVSSLSIPNRSTKTIKEHQRIYSAISSHDSKKAEKAMTEHLENALDDIILYLANN